MVVLEKPLKNHTQLIQQLLTVITFTAASLGSYRNTKTGKKS
jgi:hypothetical protein